MWLLKGSTRDLSADATVLCLDWWWWLYEPTHVKKLYRTNYKYTNESRKTGEI